MKKIVKLYGLIFVLLISNSVYASETHVVKMLNNGELGAMVFEPAFLKINSGDSIIFEMTDKGHNAVTVAGPAGSVPFDTKYKPSTTVKFDVNGLYLYKCAPHAMMAMAGIIQVSDSSNKAEMEKEIEKFEATVMMPNVKTRISDLFKENVENVSTSAVRSSGSSETIPYAAMEAAMEGCMQIMMSNRFRGL